jgi:hypothetical protein
MGPETMLIAKEEVVQNLLWKSISQLDELIWLMEERARASDTGPEDAGGRRIVKRKHVSEELKVLLNEAEL